MPPLITLLTDFGTADTYVAQMKGVIFSLLPEARLVDITHEIEPQDVVGGALALSEAAPLFPPGTIHVAVVDPGVGTQRRVLCAEIARQIFILPDNGLLSFLLDRFSLTCVYEVTDQTLWRAEYSRTFHGRDIMAPVAAQLASGTSIARVGPPAERIVRLRIPSAEFTSSSIRGEIIAIDRFGNAISNVAGAALEALFIKTNLVFEHHNCKTNVMFVSTYGDGRAGDRVVLVGSQGRLEIALVCGNAAQELGIHKGDRFSIGF